MTIETRYKGRGLPEGTLEDFKEAAETFKDVDVEQFCYRFNSGYYDERHRRTENDRKN